jgi:hypothetical protein
MGACNIRRGIVCQNPRRKGPLELATVCGNPKCAQGMEPGYGSWFVLSAAPTARPGSRDG